MQHNVQLWHYCRFCCFNGFYPTFFLSLGLSAFFTLFSRARSAFYVLLFIAALQLLPKNCISPELFSPFSYSSSSSSSFASSGSTLLFCQSRFYVPNLVCNSTHIRMLKLLTCWMVNGNISKITNSTESKRIGHVKANWHSEKKQKCDLNDSSERPACHHDAPKSQLIEFVPLTEHNMCAFCCGMLSQNSLRLDYISMGMAKRFLCSWSGLCVHNSQQKKWFLFNRHNRHSTQNVMLSQFSSSCPVAI